MYAVAILKAIVASGGSDSQRMLGNGRAAQVLGMPEQSVREVGLDEQVVLC